MCYFLETVNIILKLYLTEKKGSKALSLILALDIKCVQAYIKI